MRLAKWFEQSDRDMDRFLDWIERLGLGGFFALALVLWSCWGVGSCAMYMVSH